MLYSAHFDASGTVKDNPVLVMAGGVSTIGRWVKFEKAWNKVLTDDGLPHGTIFHMTDFVTCNGPFHIYKNKSQRKATLIQNLVSCAAKHIGIAISLGVVIQDYYEVNKHWCLQESYGSPYSFLGLMCVKYTNDWLSKKKGLTNVFFEKGDDDQNELEKLCLKFYGFKPLFIPKELMVQFQPGDLIGWKNRTAATNAIVEGPERDIDELRSILRSLDPIEHIHKKVGIYDVDGLEAACRNSGVPVR
jgi:hypothetical protein